jgi:hypothetical protein
MLVPSFIVGFVCGSLSTVLLWSAGPLLALASFPVVGSIAGFLTSLVVYLPRRSREAALRRAETSKPPGSPL